MNSERVTGETRLFRVNVFKWHLITYYLFISTTTFIFYTLYMHIVVISSNHIGQCATINNRRLSAEYEWRGYISKTLETMNDFYYILLSRETETKMMKKFICIRRSGGIELNIEIECASCNKNLKLMAKSIVTVSFFH